MKDASGLSDEAEVVLVFTDPQSEVVLFDFDDSDSVAEWKAAGLLGSSIDIAAPSEAHSGTGALRYTVPKSFRLGVATHELTTDLSVYETVSYWVKGPASGGGYILLELVDNDGNRWAQKHWAPISSDYQQVVVNLAAGVEGGLVWRGRRGQRRRELGQQPNLDDLAQIRFTIFAGKKAGAGEDPYLIDEVRVQQAVSLPSPDDVTVIVDENTPEGELLARLNTRGPGGASIFVHEIVAGNDDDTFALSKDGRLSVVGSLDFEVLSEYELTVKVTDAAGGTGTQVVFIVVQDVNEPPQLEDRQIDIANDATLDDTIAVLKATDPDLEDTLEYELLAGKAGHFYTLSSTGQLQFKHLSLWWRRAKISVCYGMSIRVTDSGGLSDTARIDVCEQNQR